MLVLVILRRLMSDFQNGTFISFDFRIDIGQGNKCIEHIHNQLELIRYERIVVYEIFFCRILAIAGGKIKLRLDSGSLSVI